MVLVAVPCASRVPLLISRAFVLNFTTVPGFIVSLTPELMLTSAELETTYTLVETHVVVVAMLLVTTWVAAYAGAAETKTPPKTAAAKTRTLTTNDEPLLRFILVVIFFIDERLITQSIPNAL